MMFRIEHVALWCHDLEVMRAYYTTCFGAESNARYHNPNTGFSSYFLTFPGGGARLELMHRADRMPFSGGLSPMHFSIQAGSEEAVQAMAPVIEQKGGTLIRGPRRTGDGYYELETLDPEGNLVEVMA